MSGPVATFDAIQADLVAKAANAARRNKPAMWAYAVGVRAALDDWFSDVQRTDDAYAGAALALTEHAQVACPNLQPDESARLWAMSVYARRVLRAWNVPAPRASLSWLRDRIPA